MSDGLANRRAADGLAQVSLPPGFDKVVDLSRAGMRVRRSRFHTGRLGVTITDGHDEVSLPAEVRWTRRLGLRDRNIGMRELVASGQQAKALAPAAVNS